MLHRNFFLRPQLILGAVALALTLLLALSWNDAFAAGVEAGAEPLSALPERNPAPLGQSSNYPPRFHGEVVTQRTIKENYGPRNTVDTYTVSDPEEDSVYLSLAGEDADRFAIGQSSAFGKLTVFPLILNATPDYENPDDADTDGVYEVTIRASDGTATTTLDITVTVENVKEAPTIYGLAAVDFAENSGLNVGQYTAADPEGEASTLTLGGTDAASFNFANSTLSFKAVPDYETKDSYSVTFTSSDGTNTGNLDVTITITNVDETTAITLSGPETLSIAENSSNLSLATYTATDPEDGTITWSLEGADKDEFTLSGGALSLNASPDYEMKNLYAVTVKAEAGAKSTVRNITVTVTDVNEPPTIEGLAAVDFTENSTADVGYYSATDPKGETATLTLGGTDADSFTFTDGTLSFKAAPDYETQDSYSVTFTSSYGTETATLDVTISIANVAEPGEIAITGSRTLSIAENSSNLLLETYTATVQGGGTATWSLEGADKDDFTFSGGALSLNASPDYETKSLYAVTVKAETAAERTVRNVTVTVTDVNEPPVVTGSNGVPVGKVVCVAIEHIGTSATPCSFLATDPEGDTVTWSLAGTDSDDFSVDSNGSLTFAADPDYESPADDDGDNAYNLNVRATAAGGTGSLAVEVRVIDGGAAVEPVTISGGTTARIDENTTGNLLTLTADDDGASSSFDWSLQGNPSNFSIANGTLSVSSGLNYEAGSSRTVTVKASNGHNSDTHKVTVTVTDVNEPPVVSGLASINLDEHTPGTDSAGLWTTVGFYRATDPEGDEITGWSLSGADSGFFSIDTDIGGSLQIKGNLNYEAPGDSNSDNIYQVTVNATTTGGTGSLAVQVTIEDIPAGGEPVFVTGPTTATVAENWTGNLGTYTASSDGGNSFTWSIDKRVGAEFFSISNGLLSVTSGLDYESRSEYNVRVRAKNDLGKSSYQWVDVTVTDVNEPPVIVGSASVELDEHSGTTVETYTATDPEGDTFTGWSLSGTDWADFSIDENGVLSFKSMPNYESPVDGNRDNVYVVNVRATAAYRTSSHRVTITVKDIPPEDEPLIITGPTTATIAENWTGYLLTLAARSDVRQFLRMVVVR